MRTCTVDLLQISAWSWKRLFVFVRKHKRKNQFSALPHSALLWNEWLVRWLLWIIRCGKMLSGFGIFLMLACFLVTGSGRLGQYLRFLSVSSHLGGQSSLHMNNLIRQRLAFVFVTRQIQLALFPGELQNFRKQKCIFTFSQTKGKIVNTSRQSSMQTSAVEPWLILWCFHTWIDRGRGSETRGEFSLWTQHSHSDVQQNNRGEIA